MTRNIAVLFQMLYSLEDEGRTCTSIFRHTVAVGSKIWEPLNSEKTRENCSEK